MKMAPNKSIHRKSRLRRLVLAAAILRACMGTAAFARQAPMEAGAGAEDCIDAQLDPPNPAQEMRCQGILKAAFMEM